MSQSPSDPTAWPKPALRRLVLLYSKCHPGELQRALAAHTDGEGHLVLPSKGSPARGYYLAILMQAAIERVFDSLRVRQRLRLKPQFGQMVLDTLYYPVFCWIADSGSAGTLNVTENALRSHLLERFLKISSLRGRKLELEDIAQSDLTYLHGLLLELAALLQSPVDLVQELASDTRPEDHSFWQAVLPRFRHGALALVEKTPVEESECKYRWRFNQYGEPLTPYARLEAAAEAFQVTVEPEGSGPTVQQMADWVSALRATIADLTGDTLGLERLAESVPRMKVHSSAGPLGETLDSVLSGHAEDQADVTLKGWMRGVLDNSECLRVALLGAGMLALREESEHSFAAGMEQLHKTPVFASVLRALDTEKVRSLASEAYRELRCWVAGWRERTAIMGITFEEAILAPETRPEIWLQKSKYLLTLMRRIK